VTAAPFPRLELLLSRDKTQRPRGVRLLVMLGLVLVGACLLAPSAPAASATTAKKPVHKRHPKPKPLYWGAWISDPYSDRDAPWDMGRVAEFEQLVGKGLSLIEFSSPWQDCSRNPCRYFRFPTEAMNNVRGYGAIPVFSWGSEATPRSSAEQPAFTLGNLINGAYDSYVREFAEEARNWGHPFFLRFDWEMNGNWFPWYEGVNGNSPGQFVAAWRHVHDIFTAVGATNATWLWCPYADTEKRLLQQRLKGLYPGDGYVDWTCLDGYNWGQNAVNPKPWRSFSEIFEPAYNLVTKKIAPRKPLMLGEFATSSMGGHKALWIKKMFQKLPRKYPRVRGLIYFNTVDRSVDWPLEDSPPAARAFALGIHKGIYANNRFGELASSPIPPPR
jgi:mannan endo-1,4-beta-mannosidase